MILWPCNMFISWIGLDACIGIHVLLVIVRVGSCLDPSAVQRQPNRVVSNVKGCYMALMVMPVQIFILALGGGGGGGGVGGRGQVAAHCSFRDPTMLKMLGKFRNDTWSWLQTLTSPLLCCVIHAKALSHWIPHIWPTPPPPHSPLNPIDKGHWLYIIHTATSLNIQWTMKAPSNFTFNESTYLILNVLNVHINTRSGKKTFHTSSMTSPCSKV